MIERIIEACAQNRVLVLLLALAGIALGAYCAVRVPLDAIPDLSDTQVILLTRWDRSPDVIEDQVTAPLVSALLGAPRVKAIRGVSDFGYSFVYVVFEDGTDPYWARSRTLEHLAEASERLPEGVEPELGPDASGVGWVFQYALVDESGAQSLADLRAFQDWRLRPLLESLEGVAEVASFGGFESEYQVALDPLRLAAFGVPLERVVTAIRAGNEESGGRLVELAGAEYMVRGRGSAHTPADLEEIAVDAVDGTPVRVRDLGTVALGPQMRRGLGDLDGQGDTVGGIVVMRHGENALRVIDRVRARLEELQPSLPAGVRVVATYDRSGLIRASISTLLRELVGALVVVSLVILVFLWHVPSAIVPIVTIPISILLAFVPMYFLGVGSNIMSLSGITISIGVLVDGAIIEVENAYKRLEQWIAGGRVGDFHGVRLGALKEVGPSVFFALVIVAVGFLPIFALEDQEGRLFGPLAITKTLTMAIAALLAITLDPAVRMLFTRVDPMALRPRALSWALNGLLVGRYYREERHPISRVLFRLYERPCRWVVAHRKATVALALALVASTVPVYRALGSEFMPPLWEGDLLYMPITCPGLSTTEAQDLMQRMDRVLAAFPEVEHVHGKAGRADTATDPAPLSMFETVVRLRPESEWRSKQRFFSGWPAWARAPLAALWPEHLSQAELLEELRLALQFPGTSPAMLMPIEARVEMLSTGVRTPLAVKVLGDDLAEIEGVATRIEAVLSGVPGTATVFAERAGGGYFLDFELKRPALARYGLSVAEAQGVILAAVGGESLGTVLDGRQRSTVSVRYARELRDDLSDLERVRIDVADGASVPIGELAELRVSTGPAMIRDENGSLASYVYVTTSDSDLGGYVERAQAAVRERVQLSEGTTLAWSGRYEHLQRVEQRMRYLVPLTLGLIALLLYWSTRSAVKTGIVLMAVPFSAIGAFWLLWLLGYNLSIATWVGMIALLGLDAETGVFMLLFLDLAYEERVKQGRMRSLADLTEAIVQGAVKRVRPKLMTVATAFLGLLPVLWMTGTGADMMKRVAAPLVGGLFTSFALELLVYPALFALWKWEFGMKRAQPRPGTLAQAEA